MTDIDASRVYWFNKLGKILTIIPTIPREKIGQSWSYHIFTGRNIPLTPETPAAIVKVENDDDDLLPIQYKGYTLGYEISLHLVRDIVAVAHQQKKRPTQEDLVQSLKYWHDSDAFLDLA